MEQEYKDFGWQTEGATHMHRHFMPVVLDFAKLMKPGTRVLDVGCGNGYTAGQFLERGCIVVGIDLSERGIAIARRTYPTGRFEMIPADERILQNLNEKPFDLIVSTEVVEHLYAPRPFARGCFAALNPGGRFICTTPYHGYWKNLAISLADKWDRHADPLFDGGHIKLWSRKTIAILLAESGFANFQFRGVGRLPGLWMTMVVSGDKPTL
jgi:2-polyprenyl-3-methyl-5-hydroxy-6-metoxy-1,4-benzoquinol methylase